MDETAAWYARVGAEADGLYADWALGISGDADVVALIAALPRPQRQPHLLFAVARLVGSPLVAYSDWRDWLVAHWPLVRAASEGRMTQTNEPARCAILVPALGLLAGLDARPLALVEIGASAGLCLYPDRYSYRYGDHRIDPTTGPSEVVISCATEGDVPLPPRLPEIAWRAGVDLAPLDVNNFDDLAWLEVLVPPEAADRRERIRAAAEIAREDPPHLSTSLETALASVPDGTRLVIVTMGTLVYLKRPEREALADAIRATGAHWLSFEAAGMLDATADEKSGTFVLTLDDRVLATAAPHGERISWRYASGA